MKKFSIILLNKFVQKKFTNQNYRHIINSTLRIVNRLAIVRFDGTGTRTGGYRITASVGDSVMLVLLFMVMKKEVFLENSSIRRFILH